MKRTISILFNPNSKKGMANLPFEKIKQNLQMKYELNIIELSPTLDWKEQIKTSLQNGARYFVAAGGDGTVHSLLNSLIEFKGELPLEDLVIGAIGLGSSNDFHKPYEKFIGAFPERLNFSNCKPWDVLVAELKNKKQEMKKVYFIVSGSVGIVADANNFFNGNNFVLSYLKQRWTGGAILFSALSEIFFHQPLKVLNVTKKNNAICFLKTQFLSGTMKINQPISHDDGKISILEMSNMGKFRLLLTLNALSKNMLKENDSIKFYKSEVLELIFEREINIELDGEIYHANEIKITVLPEKIKVASND